MLGTRIVTPFKLGISPLTAAGVHNRHAARSPDCWIRTDVAGQVTALAPAASELLSMKRVLGRSLVAFFPGDHAAVMTQLRAADRERSTQQIAVTLYPRDARRRSMLLDLVKIDAETIEWRMHATPIP
jgi:hypothetical protein